MYVKYARPHAQTDLYLTLGQIYEGLISTEEFVMIDVYGYGKLGFYLSCFDIVDEVTGEILYGQD